MITRVRMRNWKSHENTEMEFGEGINVIIGRMGAGKSSILDAISLSLFGTFPDLQSRKVSLDDVIMSRGKVKNRAEVEVCFSIDGKEYCVKRVVERGKGIVHAELRENGALVMAPLTKKVTAEVESVIGMDYDTFSRAVYGEQNNIDLFLRMGRGERKKRMDRLMGLDRYDAARDNCVRLVNRLRAEKSAKEEELSRIDRKAMEEELERKRERLVSIEREMEELGKETERLEREREAAGKAVREMEEMFSRLTALRERARALERRLSETEQAVERISKEVGGGGHIERVESLENMKKEMEDRKEELLAELRRLELSISGLSSRISRTREIMEENERIRKEIMELKASMPEAADVDSMRKERDSMLGEKAALENRLSEAEKGMEELERAGSRCPVCLSPLTEEKKERIRKEREEEIGMLRERIVELTERLRALNSSLYRAEKRETERQRIEARIAQLERSVKEVDREGLERMVKELEVMEKRRDGLERELSGMAERVSSIDRELAFARRLAEMERRLGELVKERERIGKELEMSRSELKDVEERFDEEQYGKARERLIAVERELSAARERLSGLAMLREEIGKAMDMIRQGLERHERLSEEVSFLEYATSFLASYMDGLVERQKRARERKVARINEFMEDVWQSLYPYDDFTSARLDVTENDYVLELFDGEKWVKVDGMASGGERMLASLAMRISISLLMTKQLRFIFLDEPTHNLDDNAVKMFAEVLRTKIVDYVGQVIIITHDELMEEAATSYFYRIEKSGMRSVVKSEDVGDI